MLQVSTWVRVVVWAIILAGAVIALPNALPDSVLAKFPSWLPTRAVSLGLDLQGGSHLLLEVEFDQVSKDKLESLTSDIRRSLRKARPAIGYRFLTPRADSIAVQITDPARRDEARSLIQALNPSIGGGVLAVGAKAYDFTDNGQGQFSLKMTDAYKEQTRQDILSQSIEVVRKRIDEMGTREPTIERQGDERIVVEVPGLSDPQRLIDILGKTAKMTFQLVDEAADRSGAAQRGVAPIGDDILPMTKGKNGLPIGPPVVVEKRIMVAGDRLVDARQGFDPRSGEPVVEFRFDSTGAKQFGDVTKAYPPQTQRFAIVLDKQVISAPMINEPILGGSGQITGSFSVESANDLATLLRAGALPAPLKVIERRTVGPGLGADQIKAGRYSALAGLILVALFMVARYGLFGLFADIALALNVVLLLGGADPVRRHADAARHRRHRADHGHGGRRERADLRADKGGAAQRPQHAGLHRPGLPPRHGDHHRRQFHPSDRRPDPVPARFGAGPRLRRDAGRRHPDLILHRGDGDAPGCGDVAQHPPPQAIGHLEKRAEIPKNWGKVPAGLIREGRPWRPFLEICAMW
ncbi:MAG: protein translocase subunit SecD [Rhizomicrobium sp.]